jgi:hypothetical protein
MGPAAPDPYAGFPPGFFQRADGRDDAVFYGPPRLVTHIDDAAIAAVAELYAELGIDGSAPTPRRVLDLMSSWVSHFRTPPADLVVLGMNAEELAANPAATQRLVHDLNADPRLPLPDADVDAAVCCVSIDYLTGRSRSSPTSGACCARAGRWRSPSPTAASPPRPSAAGWPPTTTSTAGWSPSWSAGPAGSTSRASSSAHLRASATRCTR